jgi:hypothetical protein
MCNSGVSYREMCAPKFLTITEMVLPKYPSDGFPRSPALANALVSMIIYLKKLSVSFYS